jgi:hypothetical protein
VPGVNHHASHQPDGPPAAIAERPSLAEGLDAEFGSKCARSGGAANRRRRIRQRIIRPLVALVFAGIAAALGGRLLRSPGPDLAAASRTRTLIDAATGEVFENHRIPDRATFPLRNPRTGEHSLYPAEACYWTPEGEAKWEPTYVYIPLDQDSVACPDCGRKITPHNPRPPDDKMLEALRQHRGN